MHVTNTYLSYGRDLAWSREEAQRLYDEADVVHHKNQLDGYAWFDNGQRKPAVLHHHGSRLRNNARGVATEAKSVGATNLVSTVDLELSLPGAEWCPSPFDLEELARYRGRPARILRIAQAPTNRQIKSTALVLRTLDRLSHRYSFEFDLIENVPWRACLSRKAKADIFIDQLVLGYGNNAIEAWAMGIPVVAGVERADVRARMLERWGDLPFYEAGPEDLESRLAELILSKSLREEWGERGRAHVQRWHDEINVVERLKDVYGSAKRSSGSVRLHTIREGVPA